MARHTLLVCRLEQSPYSNVRRTMWESSVGFIDVAAPNAGYGCSLSLTEAKCCTRSITWFPKNYLLAELDSCRFVHRMQKLGLRNLKTASSNSNSSSAINFSVGGWIISNFGRKFLSLARSHQRLPKWTSGAKVNTNANKLVVKCNETFAFPRIRWASTHVNVTLRQPKCSN